MQVIEDQFLGAKVSSEGPFICMMYGFKKLTMMNLPKTIDHFAKVFQKLPPVQGQGRILDWPHFDKTLLLSHRLVVVGVTDKRRGYFFRIAGIKKNLVQR